MYHIERRHFDTASLQLHELKQKVVSVNDANENFQKQLREQGSFIQKLEMSNEKLHRTMDEAISKANRVEIQLERKRDEISQLKNDNEFLIKQVNTYY